ncbi:MAG: hypothetical protein DRQ55_06100 [Planctomycetota bacterium]|nr:MAG: hypothetical protein DRQ55_06100 [Planctomycetota bacterium]
MSTTSCVSRGLAAALLLTPLALAGDPTQPAAELLLTRGTPLPGSPAGGAVVSVADVDASDDGYVASATTGLFADIVVVNGQWGAHAGQDLGGGRTLWRFEASIDRDAAGRTSVVIVSELDGPVYEAGVMIDDALVLTEGTAISGPGLPAGTAWEWFQGANLTDDGRLVVSGWVPDPQDPSDDVMLMASYDVLPDGTLDAAPSILRVEGEALDQGVVEWLPAVADMGWEATASGRLMHVVNYAGEGLFAGPFGIVLDDVTLALEGAPSLVPGRNWKLDAWEDQLDVSETGSWAFLAQVDGGFDGLQVLVHDGVVIAQEEQPLLGQPGTEIDKLGGPRVADNGNLFWYARWTESSGASVREGLFLNDQLVVQPGQLSGDGHSIAAVFSSPRRFDISPDGQSIIFTVERDDGEWALYEQEIGPWISLGQGLAGVGGIAPRLAGHGDQSVGAATTISLYDALPSSVAHVILGLSQLGLPHKGGVLCPNPDVLVLGLPIDANGELALSFAFPSGVPAGTDLWWQIWVQDAAAPHGLSASNCIRSTSP